MVQFKVGDTVRRKPGTLGRQDDFKIASINVHDIIDENGSNHFEHNLRLVERAPEHNLRLVERAPEPAAEDVVNHPSHYKQGGLEAIDVIEAFGLDRDFRLGNAAKYLLRAGKKDDEVQDLKKAVWYLNRYIQKAGAPQTESTK